MIFRNQTSPTIVANSISNKPIDLSQMRGKKVLIKFHRTSGCPVAQRQINELAEQQDKLNAKGIQTIVFLHSSEENITPIYKEVPGLHIIADKNKMYYQLFTSRVTWTAMFSPASLRENFRSFLKGYFPHFSKFEGGVSTLPSDFLLNESGRIVDYHYGDHVGDWWTVPEILSKLSAN